MSLGAVQILQKSLEDAQKGLSNTDDEIRRLTGRDPQTRPLPDRRNSGGRLRAWSSEYVPPPKRRQMMSGSRPRVSDRLGERKRSGPPLAPHSDEEDEEDQSNIKSSVVAAPIPPRPSGDPTEDKASKKRNQRMFGFLMGTLQKFQQDSNKKTEQEKRRAEIEEKLELAAAREKQKVARQRKELYEQRRHQQQRIGFLANQVELAEVYEEWNLHDRRLIGYIKTKAKPAVFYLPVQQNETTEKLLKETEQHIEETIAKRKTELDKIAQDQCPGMEGGSNGTSTEDGGKDMDKSRNRERVPGLSATKREKDSSSEDSEQD